MGLLVPLWYKTKKNVEFLTEIVKISVTIFAIVLFLKHRFFTFSFRILAFFLKLWYNTLR